MCLRCEETDLYFAYLEQHEATKRVADQSARSEVSVESASAGVSVRAAEARFTCEDPSKR
jgi:hypothetical protein